MSELRDRQRVAHQWLAKADEDLTIAQHALTISHDCPHAAICFHAQHAIATHASATTTVSGR